MFQIQRLIEDDVKKFVDVILSEANNNDLVSYFKKIENDLNHPKNCQNAMKKLLFMNIIGYDTSWCDFKILEIMSTNSFISKKLAYHLSEISWRPHSRVCLMATNVISKDMTAQDPLISSIVFNSINSYLTLPLVQHIFDAVLKMMTSNKTYLRQKAITTFYNMLKIYPDVLAQGFVTLENALDDSEDGVVFAAITVIYHLAIDHAQSMVKLIPKIYGMLEKSHNNFVIMRVIQVLRKFCMIENRLHKKMIEPFLNMITSATKCIFFEILETTVSVPLLNQNLHDACFNKLDKYLDDIDPNLRFFSLKYLLKLLTFTSKPINNYREVITNNLTNENESIRAMVCNLLISLANDRTIVGTVDRVLTYLLQSKSEEDKQKLIRRILEACNENDYELVSDFSWFVDVLDNICEQVSLENYELISKQLVDLCDRVQITREQIIKNMYKILEKKIGDDHLLFAAVYIIGEYSHSNEAVYCLLQPVVSNYKPHIQYNCLNAAQKVFFKLRDGKDELLRIFEVRIPLFKSSVYNDVQELASSIDVMMKLVSNNESIYNDISKVISREDDDELEIEIPNDINDPITIFDGPDDDELLLPKKTIAPEKTSVNAKKKVAKKRVSGPNKTYRRQEIGRNEHLSILADRFKPTENNILMILILIKNLSQSTIEEIYSTVLNIKDFVEVPEIKDIKPEESKKFIFKIQLKKIQPTIVKLAFCPIGSTADNITGSIKIFPSLFLKPGTIEEYEENKEDIPFSKSLTFARTKMQFNDILQTIANIVSGRVVHAENKSNFIMYSESVDSVHLITNVHLNESEVVIQLSSNSDEFLPFVATEIEMKAKKF